MKTTLYSIITLAILLSTGYLQNEHGTSLTNKNVKHLHIQNIQKSLGIK